MGYLFENMEKMDFQAEQRKAAEAIAKLKAAEEKVEAAEAKANEAEAKVNAAEAKIKELESKVLDPIRPENEPLYQMLLSLCKAQGLSQEDVKHMLIEKCGLKEADALTCMNLYWT